MKTTRPAVKPYAMASSLVFAFVALLHLIRVISQTIGTWTVPLWASGHGLIIAGGMSLWGFRLAFPPKRLAHHAMRDRG